MSLESAVEGLAQALDVWWDIDPAKLANPPLGRWCVSRSADNCVRVTVATGGKPEAREVSVGDAAILLSALALRVTLDLSCPACAGSKVQRTTVSRDARLGFEREEQSFGWELTGAWDTGDTTWARPCRECAAESEPRRWEIDGHTVCAECDDVPFGDCVCPGPGVPTGKVTRSPERWVLDAMPTPVTVDSHASAWGGVGQAMAGLEGKTLRHESGDQPTRDALGVLADRMQLEKPRPCVGNWPELRCCHPPCNGQWGTGCPCCHWQDGHRKCGRARIVFGELLMAWLAGACRVCEGSGERPPPDLSERDVPQAADPLRIRRRPRTASDPPGYPEQVEEIDTSCPKCHGLGTVLGAYAPPLEALLLELARAEGGLHQELLEDAKIQSELDRTEHRLSMSEILDL